VTLHRRRTRIAVAVAGVVLLGAALSDLGANAVQARPDAGAQPVNPEPADPEPTDVTDTARATVSCGFQQVGDYVTLAGAPGSSVSARGGWRRGNCPVERAEVSVQLQARQDGDWHDIGSPATEILRPGGRVEANATCDRSRATKWRSVIDVDLIDQSDDPDKLTTPVRVLRCRPEPSLLDGR
jgi:hypothetical protein